MKLHRIINGKISEYAITNSSAHEQDVQKYALEKQNKYQDVEYSIINIEAKHLINLFTQINENDLGYRNVCAKLYEIIKQEDDYSVKVLFHKYNEGRE